jgi:hypothetical protein
MTQVFLVCQDVDLGYHVYAICSTEEKANKFIDDYFEQRLLQHETLMRDNALRLGKYGQMVFLRRPKKEDMAFYIEVRELDEQSEKYFFEV